MFEYIKGILTEASPAKVTLETHGLGYLLLIPLNNYTKLPQIGTPLTLYVSTVIREDSHKHYGFITRKERDLFESLIEVSGIGPKIGLTLLGHMEMNDLQFAISQGNAALLSKIPGIGKKTAERLIVEMRDKITKLDTPLSTHPLLDTSGESGVIADAINALIHLGYHPTLAQKAIKKVSDTPTPETDLGRLITAALRCI
jgi:Holliday junction DNA helicase RuvA